MIINGDHNAIPPAGGKTGGPESGPAKTRRDTRPDDALEISDRAEGVAQSYGAEPGPGGTDGGMGATSGRVRTQLQERIQSGFYDSEEVLGRIADEMLTLFGL